MVGHFATYVVDSLTNQKLWTKAVGLMASSSLTLGLAPNFWFNFIIIIISSTEICAQVRYTIQTVCHATLTTVNQEVGSTFMYVYVAGVFSVGKPGS